MGESNFDDFELTEKDYTMQYVKVGITLLLLRKRK